MNDLKTSSQLKSLAREQLTGNYSKAIVIMLLIYVISYVISEITLIGLPVLSTENTFLYLMVYIPSTAVTSIVTGLITIGCTKFFMNLVSKRNPQTSDVFHVFSKIFGKSLLLILISIGLSGLCAIPAVIGLSLYLLTQSVYALPLATLCFIITVVASTLLSLSLSQTYYLLVDLPSLKAWQLIKMSMKIMKGNMFRYFYIQISFIPLYLLSVLTCGIAALWITPYVYATNTNFYINLMNYRQSHTEEE